jgi:hypothetical protein
MAGTRTHEITLHLDDIRELFRAPEIDPFAGRSHAESGMDRMVLQLRARPRGAVRARIVLPPSQLAPDLESRCREALQHYCDTRIEQLMDQSVSLRREGYATLARGSVFLAACILGAQLAAEPIHLPAILARFLNEGFVIAGWVALWYPLDALLYLRWPVHRDRQLYEVLKTMEMNIVASS